jgi:enoyl-CoA hydratase
MEMVLTGRRIRAAEAERIGLVTKLVPAEDVVSSALDLGARIAAMPPLAVRAAKAAVNAAQALPLADGLRLERDRFEELFATEDQREGMAAFLEKRAAVWKGR